MRPPRVLARLAAALPTLGLVTLVVFALIHAAPGDSITLGGDDDSLQPLTPRALAELRAQYRLDQPLHLQYGGWLYDLARGDLGRSFHDRRPVIEKIRERLGITFTINLLALAATLLVAVPLGAATALQPGSRADRLSGVVGYALYALPVFWAGLMLQQLVSLRLGWLPVAGMESLDGPASGGLRHLLDRLAHLVLPVVCLSYGSIAYVARFVRATLLENEAAQSWRAARARGLPWVAVLYRHGFRQAGVPMLTLAGSFLPALVSGSVIVERVFAIPGLGRLFVDAAFHRDVPVVMGLTLLSGVATLAGIVAADLAYSLADPRVRRG